MPFRFIAAVLLLAAAVPVAARVGTIDQVPSATLLFPHFEVAPNATSGVNTVLTIQNASATAITANVVLWTDYGIPTARFVLYLTGYDQDTVDLREVFARRVPITADAGLDPTDTISPHGTISQDINYPGNTDIATVAQGNALSRSIVAAHTGGADPAYFPGGACGGRAVGDGRARGYVTVDTVNNLDATTPAAPGYFTSFATVQNVLLGEYAIVESSRASYAVDTAVHIEASLTDPVTATGANKQTFYGRFVNFNADDHREPLPTAWGGRYVQDRTNVSFWRDTGVSGISFPPCGGAPATLPSGQRRVTVLNATGGIVSNPATNLFPFTDGIATGAAIGLTQPQGWLFLNLNLASASGPLGLVRQSWASWMQIPAAAPTGPGPSYLVPGIQFGSTTTTPDPITP